jgi:hypothetical protein
MIFIAVIAVLMLAACGKAPADAAQTSSCSALVTTPAPMQTTASAAPETSVPATPQPPEASATETESSASASVTPSLYIPTVTFHPISTPSPTLIVPSASLLAVPEGDSILGTWEHEGEVLTFFSDYTYHYIGGGWDMSGTYSHNRVTDKYIMDLLADTWVMTVEGDTLNVFNGQRTVVFQRQQ